MFPIGLALPPKKIGVGVWFGKRLAGCSGGRAGSGLGAGLELTAEGRLQAELPVKGSDQQTDRAWALSGASLPHVRSVGCNPTDRSCCLCTVIRTSAQEGWVVSRSPPPPPTSGHPSHSGPDARVPVPILKNASKHYVPFLVKCVCYNTRDEKRPPAQIPGALDTAVDCPSFYAQCTHQHRAAVFGMRRTCVQAPAIGP